MTVRYIHPEAISILFELRQGENPIPWRTFGVGVAIASFTKKSGESFPSRSAIAKRTRLDPRDISKAIRDLEDRGFLITERQFGKPNFYRIPLGHTPNGHIATPGSMAQDTPGRITQDTPGHIATHKEGNKEPKKELLETNSIPTTSVEAIPNELHGLELYEADMKLRAAWVGLQTSWCRAYPDIDYLAEVAKAHAWEVANPNKRKSDRPRFLTNWLSRVAKNPQINQPSKEEKRAEELFQRASMAYAESGIEESLSENRTEGEA